jgi:RimJ/RimL family protein N-acetyltransferase
MFPDITRDDVFRIETPRLWLRWPERRDCAAIRAYASCFAVADMTSSVPHPYPEGEAERFVAQVRASNSVGKTLELVIEHKSSRHVIGTVLVRFGQDQRPYIGYALHPDFWGQGYASEAAKALVDVVFLLTETDAMTATARSDNAASHHVLTKLGFVAQAERAPFVPVRNAVHVLTDYLLRRADYHAAYGGAMHPLTWELPTNGLEWAGAA